MAVYTTNNSCNTQRKAFYDKLVVLFGHLDTWNITVTALTHNAITGFAVITTDSAIPADQQSHVGVS